jgi:cystathionine beta-lyase family protein involved in aluminum resistance
MSLLHAYSTKQRSIPLCLVQVWGCATDLQPLFGQIDARVAENLARVQAAFKRNRIGPHHFQGSTGYGHGDLGREALDNVSSTATWHVADAGLCDLYPAGQLAVKYRCSCQVTFVGD